MHSCHDSFIQQIFTEGLARARHPLKPRETSRNGQTKILPCGDHTPAGNDRQQTQHVNEMGVLAGGERHGENQSTGHGEEASVLQQEVKVDLTE